MNICRLCLDSVPPSIKNDVSFDLKLSIQRFFNIQVSTIFFIKKCEPFKSFSEFSFQIRRNEDKVPHQVCQRCTTLIKDFDDFQTFVVKNQERLIQYMTKERPCKVEIISIEVELPEYMEDGPPELLEPCPISPIQQENVDHQENRYEKYRCKLCNKQMYNKDDYDVHKFYHGSKSVKRGMAICDICGRDFQSERHLTNHLKQHVNDPQNCPVCDQQYGNSMKLETHLIRTHIPCIYLSCQTCGRICKNKDALQSHTDKIHKEKETVKCVKCNVVLKDYHSLQRHNRIKHNLNSLRHKCKFCGKGFARKLSWADHEASHINLAKYQCEFCNRKFVSNSNFCNHRIKAHPIEYALIKEKRSRERYSNIETTYTEN